jgi:hypothetical protein
MGLRLDEGVHPLTGVFLPGFIDPRRSNGSQITIIVNGVFIYHAYDMGVWIRTAPNEEFICTNCIVSDCRLGYRLAFHHQAKDSLIVGNSMNFKCSKDFYWIKYRNSNLCSSMLYVIGFAIYDGPTELDRVHFAGFRGRGNPTSSHAFMNAGAAVKSTSHMVRRLSFERGMTKAAIVDLLEAPTCSLLWSSPIIAEDGSITGTTNSYIIPEIVIPSEFTNPFYANREFIPAPVRWTPHVWDKGFNLPPM